MPIRRRPGARGRIGVLQPAPGVMIEHEWPRRLPPEMLFVMGRLRMTGATADGYARLADAAPEAARDLASAGVGVVAYACAVGSLFAGADAEQGLIQRIETAAGVPAISLAAASLAALRQLGAGRLAMMTPYDAATNQWIIDYVEAAGFEVAGIIPTPLPIATVGDIQPDEVAALAIAGLTANGSADALWIPCTAIQTLEAIADIEAATGRPVVSGSQALLWQALEVLRVADPIVGAGRLFDQRSVWGDGL